MNVGVFYYIFVSVGSVRGLKGFSMRRMLENFTDERTSRCGNRDLFPLHADE